MRTALAFWRRSQVSAAATSTLIFHRPDQVNWVRVAIQFTLGLILVGNLLAPLASFVHSRGAAVPWFWKPESKCRLETLQIRLAARHLLHGSKIHP